MARGIAHIGVLKVLDQYKIPIDFIAGTSAGAIVGAAYAAGMEVRLLEEIAQRVRWGRILKVAFFRPGIASEKSIEEFLIKYIGDKDFSELKIPLAVVATEIKTGERVIINKGRVAKAVAASASFPGLFAPEEIDQHFLTDGGVSDNLPVDVARKMGANYVMAVDVIPSRPLRGLPKGPVGAFGRSLDLVLHQLSIKQRKRADILIEPEIPEDIWHFDLHKGKRLITAGENAAHRLIGKIRRKVRV